MTTEPIVTDGSGKSAGFPCIIVGNHEAVAITNTSTQSPVFQSGVTVVRLSATVDCYVSFGTNPTADSGDMYLNAFVAENFGVKEGWRVACMRVGGNNGSLSVAEGA